MQDSDVPPARPRPAPMASQLEAKLTLSLLVGAFWRSRNLFIAAAAAGFIGALVYLAYFTTPAYTASAVIGPASNHGGGSNQVLAAYAGLDFGENSSSFTKYMEVMYSVRAAENLESKYHVMRHVFAGWDEQSQSWKAPTDLRSRVSESVKAALGLQGWQPPTPSRLSQVLRAAIVLNPVVQTDVIRSGLYTLSFTFPDRTYAVNLLRTLLQETDQLVRQDEMTNTANRIDYLKDLINRTQELVLRDSLQRLLLQEEQSRMTLQADKYYAVDVIDPPDADLVPVSPRANLILAEVVAGALVLAALFVFYIVWRRVEDKTNADKDPLEAPFPDPFRPVTRLFKRSAPVAKRT